jgi:serine/threonine protein kinase
MTPERWRQVTDIFHASLTREASSRPRYLDEACGGDPALRAEIEAMLAAHAAGAQFGETPVHVSTVHGPRLATGAMIGAHRIEQLIGSGGMGEVYRARDTRLGRDVAIKVLPAAFTADPDRLARFEREARLLAALNHSHIAAIYGLEETEGVRALVLELVEGDTLADRLTTAAVPVKDALEIARQIAEALEAAHEHGIVHRDLKPANIKVTPDGIVKVLDFGLAKAATGDGAATQTGVIAGTPAYMSPEQARGQAVDKRTDIWAFGCVLYEMLTGHRAFRGNTFSDTIAAILEHEPDWSALPSSAPPAIRRLLHRCLAKDRRQRLSDAADARLEIDDAAATPIPDLAMTPVRPASWRRKSIVASAAVLVVGAAASITVWLAQQPTPASVSRFVVSLNPGDAFQFQGRHLVAFSPDGRHLAYHANQGLYLRRLDLLQASFVTGTAEGGGRSPFFSPDGQALGFWAGGELKRVGLSGGAPVSLCHVDNPWGASWEADGTILFGQGPRGIWKVAETGGIPEVLISVETGAEAHGPQLLPGGEWVLFTLRPAGVSSWDAAQIVVQSVTTGERKIVIERGRDARYVATGHLVYAVGGTLVAVAFDVAALRVLGSAVSLVEVVAFAANITGAVHFSLSRDGSLVYVPSVGVRPQRTLVWVDRQGREELIDAPADGYLYPRVSPDGTRVALDVLGQLLTTANRDVWIWDLARRTSTRFTFNPASDAFPVWTPDGRRLVFGSLLSGPYNIYWQAADGARAVERLTESENEQTPYSFSPDGKQMLLREEGTFAERLSLLTLGGDRQITPLLQGMFNHRNGEISPDGRWLAYESDESGQEEIYVRPFPDVDGGRWQVSRGGGLRPVWARSGRELFYQAPDGALIGVSVAVDGGSFRPGGPKKLVEGRYHMGSPAISGRTYDVSPDGQRFLMIRDAAGTGGVTSPQLVVALNWTEELKRLVPRYAPKSR